MSGKTVLITGATSGPGLYPNDEIFRSRVVMGRHGFGRGEYKYFSYPLPDLLGVLRTAVYSHLVPVANHWSVWRFYSEPVIGGDRAQLLHHFFHQLNRIAGAARQRKLPAR